MTKKNNKNFVEEIENQDKNMNIRWYASEIERTKKFAAKYNLPYQTYVKKILTEALNKEEKKK